MAPASQGPGKGPGWWQRFRSLPPKVQLACWIGLAVLLIIGAVLGGENGSGTATTGVTAQTPTAAVTTPASPATSPAPAVSPTPSPTPTPTPTREVTRRPRRPHRPRTVSYAVLRVVDGDTLQVARHGVTTVRVIGIDTPETVDPRKPVECFGPQASARARRLLGGTRVRLTLDPTQGSVDKYGRTLAYVTLADGRDYGLTMIRGGFAREYTYDTPYQRQAIYRRAERAARARQRGLWSPATCNGNTGPGSGATTPPPTTRPGRGGLDPRFATCAEAIAHGYGPYRRGVDPEYYWYRDADGDGVVCER